MDFFRFDIGIGSLFHYLDEILIQEPEDFAVVYYPFV